MKVRVLDAALEDIDELSAWVEQEHGMEFTSSTRKDLFATFDLLGDFPHLGRTRPDITKRQVRFFLLEPYWIVYQPTEPLLVHRVLHGKRDLPRLLNDLNLR